MVISYGFRGLVTLNVTDMVDYGIVLGTIFAYDGGDGGGGGGAG